MLIRSTVSWAGHPCEWAPSGFSVAPGGTIDVPEDIGLARIDAALADAVALPEPVSVATAPARKSK